MNKKALDALKLHVEYEALPADRGGKDEPKGKAWAAFIKARDAALSQPAIPLDNAELIQDLQKRADQIGYLLSDPPKHHPDATLMRKAAAALIIHHANDHGSVVASVDHDDLSPMAKDTCGPDTVQPTAPSDHAWVVERLGKTADYLAALKNRTSIEETAIELFREAIAALSGVGPVAVRASLLEEARQELALGIAFIGRDRGTDRLDKTLDGLVERFVKMDQRILSALATPPAQGDAAQPGADGLEKAARYMEDRAQEYNRIRDPGMANHCRACASGIRKLALPASPAASQEGAIYAHPSSRDDVLEEAARIAESRTPLWEEAKAVAAAIRAAKGGKS